MTIGELLKEYRIEHKKTQKEWVGNTTISPSYYCRVEENLHRITAEDLLAILHYNDISVLNFFSKLNKQDQSQHERSNEINRLISEAYYRNSKTELKQIKSLIAKSDLPDKEEQLVFVEAYIAIVSNDVGSLSKEKENTIKEIIFNINNFNVKSLSLYSNFMGFYDLDSNILISKKILKQFENSKDTETKKILLAIIINLLIFCIREKRFDDTNYFLEAASKIRTVPALFFYKNTLLLVQSLINYHYEAKQEYLDNCKAAIKHCSLLGMPEYGSELEKFYVKNI